MLAKLFSFLSSYSSKRARAPKNLNAGFRKTKGPLFRQENKAPKKKTYRLLGYYSLLALLPKGFSEAFPSASMASFIERLPKGTRRVRVSAGLPKGS